MEKEGGKRSVRRLGREYKGWERKKGGKEGVQGLGKEKGEEDECNWWGKKKGGRDEDFSPNLKPDHREI